MGAEAGRDMQRETEIESQLAKINPELVPTFREARIASDNKDQATAEKLYTDVYDKAPTFDPVIRRLGYAKIMVGKRAEGLALCEKALQINRSSDNLAMLAYVFADPVDGRPSKADNETAMRLLLECRTLPHGLDSDVLVLTVQVAGQLNRIPVFTEGVGLLQERYPDLMVTHYYTAVLEAMHENWRSAEREIIQAKKLGLPESAAEEFLNSGVRSFANRNRWIFIGSVVLGVWTVGLVLLMGAGFVLSRVTLRQAAIADVTAAISPAEQRLRKIYRAVLNISGVYYYISLPVVMLAVVAAAAFLVYLCFAFGHVPIKLVLIVVIGAGLTVFAMIKSLFVKVKSEDPGRSLKREEAEGLWQMTDEVAGVLQTRPVDEIRITPGTDLAVYERGTWREKMQDKAKRILILGTGVLNGFKQNDFRCVLAHEYGHFSHRDTAGGDIGLRVRNDILKFYWAMVQAGQASWMNLAFHFLRFYNYLFRRISHGATRLQEILADRVAAQAYGAAAFQGGLTHVIRRSIEFDKVANCEIKQGIETRRPLQNLYEMPAPEASSIGDEFAKAIQRKTTDDDTHPSPTDRFRLIAPLGKPDLTPVDGEMWDLFKDREAITREMMAIIEKNIASHRK